MCPSFTSLLFILNINCLQSVQGEGVVVIVALVFPLNPHPTASILTQFLSTVLAQVKSSDTPSKTATG